MPETVETKPEEVTTQRAQTPPATEAPPQQKADPKQEAKAPPRPRKSLGRRIKDHPIKFLVFLVLLAVLAVGGVRFWNYLSSYEDTDDAQIDGDIYAVTSRIAGEIKAVYVQDNQMVKAGQLLVELDPKDYDVALDEAKAALSESQSQVAAARPNVPITSVSTETSVSTSTVDIAAARSAVAAAQRDYQSDLADVRKSEANNVKAQADLARYKLLVAKDEISQQQYDQAVAAASAAAADVEVKRATAEASAQTIEEQQARLQQSQTREVEAQRNRPQQIALQNAQVRSRQATAERQETLVEQAQLNLSYTKILAPVDGIIGKKNAEPGQQVAPGQQLMADVPLDDLWVTANFKETQLEKMHPGQRATIHVDSYNRDYRRVCREHRGRQRGALQPAAAGERDGKLCQGGAKGAGADPLQAGQDPNHLLRPGMSVEPKVWLK